MSRSGKILFYWWYRDRDGRVVKSPTPIPLGARKSWNIPAAEKKCTAKSVSLTGRLIRKYYKPAGQRAVIDLTINYDE
jgi:hypothetical protein